MSSDLEEIYIDLFNDIYDSAFDYSTIKQMPSEWVEEHLVLPKSASRISGNYKYDNSPYVKEIIDSMHPSDPCRQIAIMKGTQCGITTGFVVPFMMWAIVNHPANMLFTSKDKEIAKRTMRTKFDLFMQESGYSELIRSNNTKAGNKRTGDTDLLKEYAGGSVVVDSTGNIQSIREHPAKYIMCDEFDTAKAVDKKEGSMRSTLEGRQTSFGGLAKIAYISSPTEIRTSNIYEVYLEGDQRKWHWECPSCKEHSPVEFGDSDGKGTKKSGLIWDIDNRKRLMPESIKYKFPCCGHEITFKEKHSINRRGKFIPTAEPKQPGYKSYSLNSLILGPGFISWEDIVRSFIKACPPGKPVNAPLLNAFKITHLGQPFKDQGEVPKIMNIMNNIRNYDIGVIPDELSKKDGNGDIMLLTLACDLGGVMNNDIEDVRLDWEVMAHSSSTATYSIDHGSIGTFKRVRTKSKNEIEDDTSRVKWTYNHGLSNSVWDELDSILNRVYISESGDEYKVTLFVVDTGHFTNLANQYLDTFKYNDIFAYGIKGFGDEKFKSMSKDGKRAVRSSTSSKHYNLGVDYLKDSMAANMKLKLTEDGNQQPGFMNFPQPRDGKYSLKGYFKHFEAEHRIEKKENGVILGFKWEKKNTSAENHFLDVYNYNCVCRDIVLDIYKRSDRMYKDIEWSDYVEINSRISLRK